MGSSISPEQWEKRKPEIMRLYYDVQMPLKSVMREMRSSEFDPRYLEATYPGQLFKAHHLSESQYRTKLRRWPRRKYKKSAEKTPSCECPGASSTSVADLPLTQVHQDGHNLDFSLLP